MNKKKLGLLLVVGVGLLALLVVVVAPILKKGRMDPDSETGLAEAEQFIEENRDTLLKLDQQLDALASLVQNKSWLPDEERNFSANQDEILLIWAHELRGETPALVDDSLHSGPSGELELLEPMLLWAKEPGELYESYDGRPREQLQVLLDRVTCRYVAVAELLDVVLPEITNLDLGREKGPVGEFQSGMTTLAVAIVDMQSMKIVATGRTKAENSDDVRTVDGPKRDLWNRTRQAALEQARRVLRPVDGIPQ